MIRLPRSLLVALLVVALLGGPAHATPATLVLGEWQRVTLSATPGVLTRIDIPRGARRVWVQWVSSAGKLTHTGTDGAAIGSHFGTFPADSWVDARFECAGAYGRDVGSDGCSVYVASAGVSTVVELYATSADS